ncbi:hypothetical protein WN51_04924 [Melipona quadrifasciata]|uniref:Uncharacterized protein n=1 Tax=Melipona quadrifasciata TaxID=166423 RepID=A0A0N0BDB2_9HYME|nr:hypothetical protein WN51_04924 [Melipona quadrifasciata]
MENVKCENNEYYCKTARGSYFRLGILTVTKFIVVTKYSSGGISQTDTDEHEYIMYNEMTNSIISEKRKQPANRGTPCLASLGVRRGATDLDSGYYGVTRRVYEVSVGEMEWVDKETAGNNATALSQFESSGIFVNFYRGALLRMKILTQPNNLQTSFKRACNISQFGYQMETDRCYRFFSWQNVNTTNTKVVEILIFFPSFSWAKASNIASNANLLTVL